MSMRALEDLKDKLCEELDEIARKPEMGAGDLEIIHKLTDTIKNIGKIEMLEDDDYSQRGDWDGDMYERGNSYARRGEHYVRGHYSRDGGYSRRDGRRDSRGRYSRDGSKENMVEELRDLMGESTGEVREAIRKAIKQIENT